jgi:hypothetical protein
MDHLFDFTFDSWSLSVGASQVASVRSGMLDERQPCCDDRLDRFFSFDRGRMGEFRLYRL